jgi:hypothetical protein
MQISQFRIKGLFGDRNVVLPLDNEALILVGPNGLGKSSVASIFYLTISRQWQRLLQYSFDEVSLRIGDADLSLKRDEISGLAEFHKLLDGTASSRTGDYLRKLNNEGLLEKFITTERLNPELRSRIAKVLDMPFDEVPIFHRHLGRRLSSENPLFVAPRMAFEKTLQAAVPSRVLYLPTYRRIEKDIRDVFPDFEERYRRYSGPDNPLEAGRFGSHYTELVSFGMEDVRKNISKVMEELRNYSLWQYNNLSGGYLRDVIRGKASDYSAREINSLTDTDITAILDRVSVTTLSLEEKQLLRERIKKIQNKKKAETPLEDRYLAHYFSKLVAVTKEIQEREREIASFVRVCNKYLRPTKRVIYNEIEFALYIEDERSVEIDLSALSSGEKQILSVFSHLYLEKNGGQIIVIDEPELSLSVPWQREFLPDITSTETSMFILAVTHSPFIYENRLKGNTLDLRRLTQMSIR